MAVAVAVTEMSVAAMSTVTSMSTVTAMSTVPAMSTMVRMPMTAVAGSRLSLRARKRKQGRGSQSDCQE
jgi:hypothetical protein